MIDIKLYNAINENNKKEHLKYIKKQKRKATIDTIYVITGILAIVSLFIVLGIQVHQDTLKYVNKCLKTGQTREYCLYDANR